MKIILNILSKKAILFCLLLLSLTGFSQTQFTISLANQSSTATTFEVDVMLTVPEGGRRIMAVTAGINFDNAILNGGTPCTTANCGSWSLVAGSIAPEFLANGGLNPLTLTYKAASTPGHLRIVQSSKATSLVDVAAGTYRVGRFKFTNTVAWASNSNANLWLSPVGASVTNTTVSQAPFGAAAPIQTLGASTTPAAILGYTSTSTYSVPLSVPTDICFTSGSAVSTPPTIFGGSNGSATITMSPAPSSASITYSVDGGASTPGTLNASNEFTVSGLTAGSHTVTVTGSGACTTGVPVTFTVAEGTAYNSSVTSYCGLTMPKLASTIYCSVPSGVTGTLTYRFKVKKSGTLDAESIVNRTVNSFNLSLLPAIASYGTSYDVRVAAVVDGLEQPTSAVCVVTTPSTVPAVSVNQCGATLAALNSVIGVNALTGATSFRYVVAASTAPTVFYTLTSSFPSFRLTDVPGLVVSYGSTYSVSAQQFVSNGAEFVWSPAGTCNVNTPSATSINVQINQCGQTLATMKTKLTVNGVPGATAYTFRVSTQSNFSAPVQEITNPYSSLSLNQITAFAVATGTQYYVQVSVTANGVPSAFGTPCSFSTPELASKSIADAFSAVAYPNPFADSFMIDVTTSTKENINIKVYDMVGRMVEQRNATANDLEKSSIGDAYPSGVYNVILTQGSETKALRVIKR